MKFKLSINLYFVVYIIKRMTEVVIKVIGNYSYQTSKCLGEGVYGKVYEGMERQSKEKVAIKKIDLATFTNDKYLQNAIFSQIYLLKRFNHPNIVKFKDVLSSKNSLYIITQFCKNGDLKQLLKKKKFKQQQAFQIMYQIMNGFSELIRQKIVHRDLKPANILINEGVYKIGDFGFAKYVDNFGSQMLKSCVGSPIYMAPQILQRSQYTTKCDIWSLGIIFYQMLFGYPPWKARDQPQLLRGIKTISIIHILKRNSNNLSSKAIQFLKRTLAYSQQQRVGWGELFELFNQKQHESKSLDQIEKMFRGGSKERTRMLQMGATTTTTTLNNNMGNNNNQSIMNQNQSIMNQNQSIMNQNQSIMNQNQSITSINMNSNKLISSPGSGGGKFQSSSLKTVSMTGFNSSTNNPNISISQQRRSVYSNSQSQIQNVTLWRQFCIYYHYYTVELYTNLGVIRHQLGSIEIYGQLLLILSMLVKCKSTYSLSILSLNCKGNKLLQELLKRMKLEHQTYQLIYNEINNRLEVQSIGKTVRNQIYNHVGRSEIINQDKNQKLQTIMIKYANQNAQVISDQVRKKAKTLKDIKIVQILNYILEVLSLGIGKIKALKELKEAPRMEEEDLKDYITRVISKLDRITATN